MPRPRSRARPRACLFGGKKGDGIEDENENEDEQETVATFVGTFVGLGFFDKGCD
jgi:hypothetical protein